MRRIALTVLPVLALLAFAAGGALWLGDQGSQSATATPPTESTPAPAQASDEFGGSFSLVDQNGVRRTDMDFRGKYMLVFFGYTYCPDICPTTLAVESEALDQIGARAERIVPIFITVDPKRDTSEKLKSYLSAFDAQPPSVRPNVVGLTGTADEIEKAAAAYEVYYRAHLDGRTTDGSDYSVDHSGHVYLMSPEGKFIAYYTQGIRPDELAADLLLKTSTE